MKKLIYLPLMLLLVSNCYLTDLEEFKYLEKHDDHIYLTASPSTYTSCDDIGHIRQLIKLNFQFSIKRVVCYDFFHKYDGSEQISKSLINIKSDNGKEIPSGEHHYENEIVYDPVICGQFFTIRVQAISDVDTIVEYFQLRMKINMYCEKGGVDSTNVRLQFGNDSNIISYVNTGNFDESVLNGNWRNLIIVAKFSQAFNKPYIMVLDRCKVADELPYNFIIPKNIDSLSSKSQTSLLIYSFLEYEFQNKYVDREFLSNIWEKKEKFYSDSAIYELSPGKQYALIYSTFSQDQYLVFFLKVSNIVYENNNESGYADCVLYRLN